MNYEQFKNLIESLRESSERTHTLNGLGINLMDYNDLNHHVIDILMKNVFDDDGLGWIDWYLYERMSFKGDVLAATDKHGQPICYDIPSLWETVKEHLKTK
jgi:hypothetical protein